MAPESTLNNTHQQQGKKIKPENLNLRCYTKQRGGLCVAVCIDLPLAAQSNTLQESKTRLYIKIKSYVNDALTNKDRDLASHLLSRKAPFLQRLIYHACLLFNHVGGTTKPFIASMPLKFHNRMVTYEK